MSKKKGGGWIINGTKKVFHYGIVLQTRDEFFQGQGSFRKIGYEHKGNYRKAVVVDSNRKNELAVVKLYSHSGKALRDTKSRYKPFVETKDDKNRPIKVGRKFIKSRERLSNYDVATIKKDSFTSKKYRKLNKNKVRWLKRQ